MGQCGAQVQFLAAGMGVTITFGIAATRGGASDFMVRTDTGARVAGIGPVLSGLFQVL